MNTIEVDFDVYKQLTLRRETEHVTYNDVVRGLLGLKAATASEAGSSADDWIVKGVRFQAGTELRATYKGKTFTGRVQSGGFMLNGQRYDSPSPAAMSVTDSAVNGWRFWECRLPGTSSWQLLESFRR